MSKMDDMRSGAVYVAQVIFVGDADRKGWLKLKLANQSIWNHAFWARPCFATNTFWMPNDNDFVFVFFESGSWEDAYWTGFAYPNGVVPEEIEETYPQLRLIKTAAGHVISFDDTEGQENITITSAIKNGNRHKIVLDTAAEEIRVEHSSGKFSILVTAEGNVEFLAESVKVRTKDLDAAMGEIKLRAGEKIRVTDSSGNTILLDSRGILLQDKSRNTIRLDSKGFRMEDVSGSRIEMKSGKIKINARGEVSINNGRRGVVRAGDISTPHTHVVVTATGPVVSAPATVVYSPANVSRTVKAG